MTFQAKKLARTGDRVVYMAPDRGTFVHSEGQLAAINGSEYTVKDDKGKTVKIDRSQAVEFRREE